MPCPAALPRATAPQGSSTEAGACHRHPALGTEPLCQPGTAQEAQENVLDCQLALSTFEGLIITFLGNSFQIHPKNCITLFSKTTIYGLVLLTTTLADVVT